MSKILSLTPLDKIKDALTKQEIQMAELRKTMGKVRSSARKRTQKS
jgi:hypothetical protein